MDSKTFLSEKLKAKAYDELAELAFNIIKKIKQIPNSDFEASEYDPDEEIDGSVSFFKAKSIIEKHYSNYLSSLNHFAILNFLEKKYSNESYSAKISVISSLLDNLLDKHKTEIIDSKVYLINGIADYNIQLLENINKVIFFRDKMLLAKILVDSEYENAAVNQQALDDLNDPYEYDISDEVDSHCALCENNPCICSDPQHNW